tara:strand:- start:454 stop:1170 length:717 start_codon:yes stop_codon:yes gene_type:complete
MNKLPTIVILAGGYGTRLQKLTENIPKSMVEINNKPFIYHQLTLLKKNNLDDVIICTGHLSNKIEEYVGNGQKFKLSVRYSNDGENLLGTGGAIKKASEMINGPFFVLYGDSYLDICYKELYDFYIVNKKKALMSIIKNNNKWDKSNVVFKNNKIISYKKKDDAENMQYIDYGLSIFKKQDLESFSKNENFDLSKLYEYLMNKKELIAFEVYKRFYEIGSLSGINELSSYLQNSGETV